MSSNLSPTAIKIKELRTNMDLTQKEFAELINVSTVSISSYETGVKTPSLDMIINIAQKCNVSIDWLCGLSDKMTLDHHITTYKDVFKSFVDVLGTTRYQDDEIKPIFQKIDIDKNFDTVLITLQNDCNFHIFFEKWYDIFKLHLDGTIDEDLYKMWIEKQLKEYDRPINGLPF